MKARYLPALAVAAALLLATAAVRAEVLYTEKSLYRNIFVYEENGLRCMTFGRWGRQTCMSLSDRDYLVFDYTRMMMASLYLNPSPQRVLIIGLGGGTLPSTLAKMLPSAKIDTVEIDPAVVRVARKFFDFAPGRQTAVFEEDGRVLVKRMLKRGTKYDLVMLDAFDDQYIPEHLLTREFLLEVKGVLAQRGVLAANTFSSSRLYDHESATYYSVFGDFYRLKTSNRVILLRLGGLPEVGELARNANRVEDKLRPLGTGKDWLLPLFGVESGWPPNTRILTDQYSPSNLLNRTF
ncbi:MAG TPA: fused MFS/spermidine synthase [Casimicrobiaceae bacterium]